MKKVGSINNVPIVQGREDEIKTHQIKAEFDDNGKVILKKRDAKGDLKSITIYDKTNLRVVEGEVILANEDKNLIIFFDNATPPINAAVFMVDFEAHQENEKSFGSTVQYLDGLDKESRSTVYWSASGTIMGAGTLQVSGTGIHNNRVIFSSSRAFLAGTYKYKLYFKI